jgi:serine/threonine-protein phosphatase 2A regulatory subunit B'
MFDRHTEGRKSSLSVFVPKAPSGRPFDKFFKMSPPSFRPSTAPPGAVRDSRQPATRPRSQSADPICDWNPAVNGDEPAPPVVVSHWVDLKFANYGPLPAVTASNFASLAIQKCDQCSIRCNFAYETADTEAKAIKTADLTDLVHIFDSPANGKQCPSKVYFAIARMILANITRRLPGADLKTLGPDDTQTIADPEWVHLSLVYQLLIRLHTTTPTFIGFSRAFVASIIPQLLSPDERERSQIIQFLQSYIDAHDREVLTILDSLGHLVSASKNSPLFPCLVGATLALIPIICRFSKAKARFHSKLVSGLIWAFFTSPFLSICQQPLISFIQSNLITPREHLLIVEVILKCWPVMLPHKQASFLKFLGLLLVSVEPKLSHARSAKLFRLIGDAAASPSAPVATAALNLLIDSGLDAFVADHSRLIFPILYPIFTETSNTHWSFEVRDSAKRALSFLSRMDPQMFREVARKDSDMEAPASCVKSWSAVCRQAADNDPGFNVRVKLAEILKQFAQAKVLLPPPAQPALIPGRRGSRQIARPDVSVEHQRRFSIGGFPRN